MARIIDKDTRIIDIDFGMVIPTLTRAVGSQYPTAVTHTGNGASEIISSIPAGDIRGGSFIQYQRIDLSYMLQNNEIMQPVNVSVQRTSSVPLGGGQNGNNFDQTEEYLYVLTRPLNNTDLFASGTPTYAGTYSPLRTLGLDGAEILGGGNPDLAGRNAGWPDQVQCVYAEQRLYSDNLNRAATVKNGELIDLDPAPNVYNTLTGSLQLDSVNTWGSMDAITGPNLHVYRVVIMPNQDFSLVTGLTVNETLGGISSYIFPPVNVSFLCKDPSYSEGEYITRIANAMNSTPLGGLTNE